MKRAIIMASRLAEKKGSPFLLSMAQNQQKKRR
jgi:hypothetical protein